MVKRGMLPAVGRGEDCVEEEEEEEAVALGNGILKRRGPLVGSYGYMRNRCAQKTSTGQAPSGFVVVGPGFQIALFIYHRNGNRITFFLACCTGGTCPTSLSTISRPANYSVSPI